LNPAAAASNQSLSAQSSSGFGCGMPLLSSALDFADPNDVFAAGTTFGRILAAANSNFRMQVHQQQQQRHQDSTNHMYAAGGGMSNAPAPNIYGLPPPLRFGPPSTSYFMNSAPYNAPAAYSIPPDFLNPSAAAVASNMISTPPTDSIWDNRWSQDFQEFLNSCLPDSSSRSS